MKYISYLLSFFLLITASISFADDPTTLPTAGSKPVPSISQTKNKDVVLTEKVQNALQNSEILQGQAVSAVSQNAVVTLQGSVDTIAQEHEAIRIAKKVSGVKKVISQLTIKKTSSTNNKMSLR